jgi:hypothetical protein
MERRTTLRRLLAMVVFLMMSLGGTLEVEWLQRQGPVLATIRSDSNRNPAGMVNPAPQGWGETSDHWR